MRFCPGRTAVTGAALVIATAPALGQTTSAQGWPSRVPTIVVSFPAGGPTDVLARTVATDLADRLGQQLVENRSGAGGNGRCGVGRQGRRRRLYAPFRHHERDQQPLHVSQRAVRCRPRLCPDRVDLQDADRAGGRRGDRAKGSRSADRPCQSRTRQAQSRQPWARHRRPYHRRDAAKARRLQADARALPRLGADDRRSLGNQIDVVSDLLRPDPQLKAGKYAGIAVTGAMRSAALPDLPTVAESGFPGFEATSWNALLAPGRRPTSSARSTAASTPISGATRGGRISPSSRCRRAAERRRI